MARKNMTGVSYTTSLLTIEKTAKLFFENQFNLNPKRTHQSIQEILSVFTDIYSETIAEIIQPLGIIRSRELNALVEDVIFPKRKTPLIPDGSHVDKAAASMDPEEQKTIRAFSPFQKFALELRACQGRGPIKVPLSKGSQIRIRTTRSAKSFYIKNFRSPATGQSFVANMFAKFYELTIKGLPTKILKLAHNSANNIFIPDVPHLGALGYHLLRTGIRELAELPVFTRACLEIHSGYYKRNIETTQVYLRINRRMYHALADQIDLTGPRIAEVLISLAPALIVRGIYEAIDSLGVPAIRALLDKRIEWHGQESIFSAGGIAILRLCKQLEFSEDIDPKEIHNKIVNMSPLAKTCLEGVSPKYWFGHLDYQK